MADINSVNVTGRFTKNPELKKTTTGKSYCTFALAINEGKNREGYDVAQFPTFIAWNKAAENIYQYMRKGSRIGITGKIQTDSWDKSDGTKGYRTNILVEKYGFLDSKKDSNENSEFGAGATAQEENLPSEAMDISNDDLPF